MRVSHALPGMADLLRKPVAGQQAALETIPDAYGNPEPQPGLRPASMAPSQIDSKATSSCRRCPSSLTVTSDSRSSSGWRTRSASRESMPQRRLPRVAASVRLSSGEIDRERRVVRHRQRRSKGRPATSCTQMQGDTHKGVDGPRRSRRHQVRCSRHTPAVVQRHR